MEQTWPLLVKGGGSAPGAAPVSLVSLKVASLTVGAVTRPFGFEGSKRGSPAVEGINELREHVDTL